MAVGARLRFLNAAGDFTLSRLVEGRLERRLHVHVDQVKPLEGTVCEVAAQSLDNASQGPRGYRRATCQGEQIGDGGRVARRDWKAGDVRDQATALLDLLLEDKALALGRGQERSLRRYLARILP